MTFMHSFPIHDVAWSPGSTGISALVYQTTIMIKLCRKGTLCDKTSFNNRKLRAVMVPSDGLLVLSGACHGDELGYLFTVPLQMGDIEKTAVRRMVKLRTNFAKYGNPKPTESDLNIEWKQLIPDNMEYLDFDKELMIKLHPESARLECWREVYKLNNITAKFL